MSNFQEWCVKVLPLIQAAANGGVVQVKQKHVDDMWHGVDAYPMCFPVTAFDLENYDYRIKPRTIMIGNIEVPEPMEGAPRTGNWYYMITANPHITPIACHFWVGDCNDLRRVKSGLCHGAFSDAVSHYDALIALTAKKDASHE